MGVMIFMSLVVFAGSAQLAVLPLMGSGAPVWVVWAAALCVNLRFMIFSAAWRPCFVGSPLGQRLRMRLACPTADLHCVMFMRRFPDPKPAPEQLPCFWGGIVTNWLAWQVLSLAGIVLADAVPVPLRLGLSW